MTQGARTTMTGHQHAGVSRAIQVEQPLAVASPPDLRQNRAFGIVVLGCVSVESYPDLCVRFQFVARA